MGLLLDHLSGKLFVSRTISIFMVIGPIIPLLGIYPKGTLRNIDKNFITEMLIRESFLIWKNWK